MCNAADDEPSCGDLAKLTIQRHVIKEQGQAATCKKCNEKATINLRMGDTYCTSCLQVAVTHKFRSCLGKSKLMRPGENVLLAYSGGLASTALLHLTQQGLMASSHKKLRFQPTVVYIDESSVIPNNQIDQHAHLKEIASKASQFGFPFFVTTLAMIMAPESERAVKAVTDECSFTLECLCAETHVTLLRNLFDSLKSLSSKEDLLLKLRHQLLHRVAEQLGCTKICVGDTETRIAVRVLADIALGKGSQLTQNCGFADGRYDNVLLVRPLRETLAKEISFYVKSHNLETVIVPQLTTKQNGKESIQHCTESFVYGLEEESRSTVSTIFRVGDKMGATASSDQKGRSSSAAPVHKNSDSICVFCSGILDAEGPDFQLTSPVSPPPKGACDPEESSCGECSCSSAKSTQQSLSKSDLVQLLCYSCRLFLKEMKDVGSIPPFVKRAATRELQRRRMKNEISQYLLDPEST